MTYRLPAGYWFLTFFQFAAVLCGMVAATGLWRGSLKPGSLALLAIITTLILESTKVGGAFSWWVGSAN